MKTLKFIFPLPVDFLPLLPATLRSSHCLAVMLLWLHSKGYAVYPPSLAVTPTTHTHTQTRPQARARPHLQASPAGRQRSVLVHRMTILPTVEDANGLAALTVELGVCSLEDANRLTALTGGVCSLESETLREDRRHAHVKACAAVCRFICSLPALAQGIKMLLT